MSEVIKSKTTKIGNSIWVLVPKDVVKEKGIEPGSPIKISIIDEEKDKTVEKTFGIFKGTRGFTRRDRLERGL
ncbi:MAG: hypothetical protein V3R82_05705 [Candidatus Hydrothermarchaeales archaeon]